MDGKKDALAEPCFMLIGEIFELRGSKSLMGSGIDLSLSAPRAFGSFVFTCSFIREDFTDTFRCYTSSLTLKVQS